MPDVEIYEWNPARPRFGGRVGRRLPLTRRVNNFGDLLGSLVVEGMLRREGLERATPVRDTQLLSVGSVMHFARPGAVVWGSGVNGKIAAESHTLVDLDVRAVRGPLTRLFLLGRGVEVPEVFGDPALLLAVLHPELLDVPRTRDVTVVPNLNDGALLERRDALRPTAPLWTCLRTIAASRFVAGSSLHAIIVAEALGIPARLVRCDAEPEFKYADYYLGTGRSGFTAAGTVEEALELGGEEPPRWEAGPLIDAFPFDLWR